ncbi:DUF2125 domain-containing protein [Roseovarius faecimaris]|nr:DUF2125 domain-containing protein [Roseovarius faecimaris]
MHKTAASVAALSIFMSGTAAFAEVSAQAVWDDWKGYMTGFGYTIDGSEAASGGTLTVSDVTMSMQIPEEDASVSMTLPQLSFVENGDGTVSIELPPVMPMNIRVDTPGDDDADIALEYVTDAFSMVVSGETNDLLYTYSANAVSLALKTLVVEGQTIDVGAAEMSVANLAGTTSMKVGNLRVSEQSMTTGPVSLVVDFKDPSGSGYLKMNSKYDTMSFDGGGSFPMNMNPDDMAAMLKAGFGFNGGFSYTGGATDFEFEDRGERVEATTSSDSGALQMAMDESQLAYAGTASNMKMMMAGGEIPFPVELAMQDTAFSMKMPLSKSDSAQEFALGLTLGDFTMSDMIWGIFDPAGQLPRDPATVALDLTGMGKLNFDVMDPAQMEAVERGQMMPGELNALTLKGLTVRLVGAELTGNGDFTFDNSNLETFDGMPAPDGAVNLKLTGGNALIDKLVAMGLLPEEQAMGARMMMGLFAVPGEGEDSLTSKIEVKPDGKILANGQRIQ